MKDSFLYYLGVLCAGVLVAPTADAHILTGPISNPGNGHSYYLLTQNTWTASEAEALTLGGHLATINDAAENTWVLNTFSGYGGSIKTLWIGLNDAAQEGVFVWSSGEAAPYRHWTSWNPDNSGAIEDYVHMYDVGRGPYIGFWNDYGNYASESGIALHGVVEVIPEPSAIVLFLLGLFALSYRKVGKDRIAKDTSGVLGD